jgi:hypothetical protein
MKPRKHSSGVNGKLIYLNSTENLSKRLQKSRPHSSHPPFPRASDSAASADRQFIAGNESGAQTKAWLQGGFNEQIYSLEAAARKKCLTAIQSVETKMSSGWYRRYLEDCILPTYSRIGFDDCLTRSLFTLAAPAWESAGPISHTKHWCQPNLIEEINEIRDGILVESTRQDNLHAWPAAASQQKFLRVAKDNLGLENMTGLLDEISTSWIILPRVYHHLKKDHCRYLPAYLRFINKESNAACSRVFIRLIIHFTANYTLKFAAEIHPKDKVKEILVSGYEAMFWKNLRCPPDGLEEVSVFENFLNWIKVSQTSHSPVNDIANEMVRKMAAMQAKIFPLKSRVYPGRDGPVEGDRFLLTLRHGSHGIRALLRYFCQGHSFLKAAIGRPPQNQSELLTLQSLIQSIKNGFNSESPRTQQSILKFLAHLKSVFCVKQDLSTPVRNGCRSLIRFVGPRTVDMIHKLCDEIQ